MEFVNESNFLEGMRNFNRFCIIDDFLIPHKAHSIAEEFLEVGDPRWAVYDNPVENKLACAMWDAFGPETYKFFTEMNTQKAVNILKKGFDPLVNIYACPGMHGGGMHMHTIGGNLNQHLDYEIHPKLGLKRKLNVIVYLSSLNKDQGGQLGFWDDLGDRPGKLIHEIEVKFNRAVIFETERMWHGMVTPMQVEEGVLRKSLAIYYLTDPTRADGLKRASYVAREGQKVDPAFLKARSTYGAPDRT